ncbi:flagellar export chaperone FliS [Anaerosporobacter faecicola]|uniref:flagellar export chaperone FliS n=1 Tax=Anaerosporobacter faecicola TaxID=2718714 RepID=UPI00143AB2FD|nr:flagellar protein FliS [Anaerosporobacter faecicola]
MKNELTQAYVTRITQANRSELVVIIYEIILTHLNDAQEAYHKEEQMVYKNELEQAQKFLLELMSGLDFAYEISKNLMSIYLFVNKTLLEAKSSYDSEVVERVIKILESLKQSFVEVGKSDNSQVLMQNTQKVYAGLTYGKNSLNEMTIEPGEESRGFFA